MSQTIEPGSSPGLLPSDVTKCDPDLRVTVICFDSDTLTEVEMPLADVQPPDATDTRVTWVRFLQMPDPDSLAFFGGLWGLHPLDLEDVLNLGQRPKSDFREDFAFTVLQAPHANEDGTLGHRQVNLFYGPNYVISIVADGPALFDRVLGRLHTAGSASRIRSNGAAYLYYALLDATIDHGFPAVAALRDFVETLESQIVDAPDSDALDALHRARRDITTLRRFQRPACEAVERLIRHEESPLPDSLRSFLKDCYDHQMQVMGAVDALREDTLSMQELYLSLQGHRLNDVMKVLTIISTIFIPMSFLTGLYGMNFDADVSPWNMPELDSRFGYPLLLCALALIAVSMLVFFRRRRWI